MKDTKTLKGAVSRKMKLKIRLGRYLGFEVQRPKEKESVAELKARLRSMEQLAQRQQRHIKSLKEGFTYIQDLAGNLYRLCLNGATVGRDGYSLDINWVQFEAVLADGTIMQFRRSIEGALQEWVRDQNGKLVQVH